MLCMTNDDILNEEEISSLLKTEKLGKSIVYIGKTTSTNVVAKEKSDMPCGTIFVSDIQTDGRGRRGKSWISESADGLWMSILLKPDIKTDEAACVTLVAGLAVCKALRKLTGADVLIKWPNDIVLDDKKLCGILCEMSCKEDMVRYVVCGIGINLNTEKFDDEIKNIACSVKSVTGIELKRSVVCAEVLNCFEPLYNKFISTGLGGIISEYKKYCVTVGKEVSVIKGDNKINAFATDVAEKGELVVRYDNREESLSSGEVSVRGIFGYI